MIATTARLVALAPIVCIAALALSLPAQSQDQTAVVEVVTSSKDLSKNKDVDVEIRVRDATNLGGFQIVISVDPNVLEPISIAKTDFLGSSGREVVCKDPPTIDSASILYNCVTLRPTPEGVDGSGTLAIATFRSKGTGTTTLSLNHVKLAHPNGDELQSTTTDGSLKVTSSSGFFNPLSISLIAIAAVVGVVVIGGGAIALSRRGGASVDRPLSSR